MTESGVLVQYVVQQRTQSPIGLRIWSDGKVQRCGNNAPPGATERLDIDRELMWQDEPPLDKVSLTAIRDAIQVSGIFEMEPRLLINYCKDDPGAAIWNVLLDGRMAHVVMYDPKPNRSVALDTLMQAINAVLVP